MNYIQYKYKHYTNLFNYGLFIFNIPPNTTNNEQIKFQSISHVLNNYNQKYIVWLNMSSVFNDLNSNITKYLIQYKDYDIIISNEVIIFKNTKWVKDIVKQILNNHTNLKLIAKNNKKAIVLSRNILSFKPTKINIEKNPNPVAIKKKS